MRRTRFIAGLLGLLLAVMPGAATAGLTVAGPTVRLPLIGTPYSMAVPQGFALAHDRYGVLTDDNLDALVFPEPNSEVGQAAVKNLQSGASALVFKWLGKLGIGNKVETVQSGGAKFVVISNSNVVRSVRLDWWRVTPLDHPDVAIDFVQIDGRQHIFDRDAVVQAIATLKPSREGTVKGGVYASGLFIPAKAPFIWSALTSSGKAGGKGALLSAPGAPPATIDLAFPASTVKVDVSFDTYLWSIAGARYAPRTGAVLEDARRTSLGGIDAVRSRIANQEHETIEYVAGSGGYPIVMTATCNCWAMPPALVDSIDEIAASIRPQTQEELAGARP